MSYFKHIILICLLLTVKAVSLNAQQNSAIRDSEKKGKDNYGNSEGSGPTRKNETELIILLKKKAEAKRDRLEYEEAILNLKLSEFSKRKGLYRDGLNFLEAAVSKFREINLLDTLPELQLRLCDYYNELGYETQAVTACEKGLNVLDTIKSLNPESCIKDSPENRQNEKLRTRFLQKLVEFSNKKGDNGKALLYNKILLEILKKDYMSPSYATVLNNIGICYLEEKDAASAEKNFKEAIRILETLKDEKYGSSQAQFKINLSNALIQQRKYQEAETELNQTLKYCKNYNLIPFESEIYCYKSVILLFRNDIQGAQRASSYSVTLAKRVTNNQRLKYLQQALRQHAQTLKRLGDYKEANEALAELTKVNDAELKEQIEKARKEKESREKAKNLEEQFEDLADMGRSFQRDLELAEKDNEIQRAIAENAWRKQKDDSTKYLLVLKNRESELEKADLLRSKQLIEEENLKTEIRNQELERQFEAIKKQKEIKSLEQKKLEAESKKKQSDKDRDYAKMQQKRFFVFSIVAIFLAASAAYFGWDSRRKNKRLKEGQDQIESANKALGSLNRQLAGKNKSITESIQYARGIQAAILPGENRWNSVFPDSFVFYVPKDIVSGDFYFLSSLDDKHIMAFADCTGHGVPGALMSIIGHNLLTSAIDLHGLSNPAEILTFMDQGLRNTLQQDGQESQDGMEVGICVFDLKNDTLEYAGSRRPLYGMKDGEFFEWKGDRHYLGSGKAVFSNFTYFSCPLENLSEIWLSSDGYPDQFGGPDLKRFHSGKLKQLLASLAGQNAENQKEIISKTFTDWKINTAQLDDVMVIGIRPQAMRKSS